jgi:hypothetical protein
VHAESERMKHVTYGDRSLFVNDEAADGLMEYARALGSAHLTDTVTLRAIGPDGNDVEATFLLNAGTELLTETASRTVQAPPNDDVETYMRERTRLIMSPPDIQPVLDSSDFP